MLKNAFLYRVALYELKNCSFPQNKRFSFTEHFTNFTQSHFYAQKLLLYVPFFAVLKNFHFHKPNGFLLQKALRTVLKSRLFMCKKPFILTNLSLLPSKAILFCPPQPIPTALNLLVCKECSCSFDLHSNSLCCKAGASHRFKSSPAIPGNLTVFCTAGYMMMAGRFRKNHESSGDLNRRSQDGVPCAFWLLFAQRKK